MSLMDAGGLVGVLMVLVAYAAATMGRLDPRHALSLLANFLGSALILASLLTENFNLSAAAMEGAWALVALVGLVRLALARAKPR